jgi:hypothetical protein
MKKILAVLALMVLIGCGKSGNGGGLPPVNNNPEEPIDNFQRLGRFYQKTKKLLHKDF